MSNKIELLEYQAEVFKALGHPSRLLMVNALREGEKCVCELQSLVGDKTPTISRHLSILKDLGIVSCRKQGLNVYYRLEMSCLNALLACTENFVQRCPDNNDQKSSCCCSNNG